MQQVGNVPGRSLHSLGELWSESPVRPCSAPPGKHSRTCSANSSPGAAGCDASTSLLNRTRGVFVPSSLVPLSLSLLTHIGLQMTCSTTSSSGAAGLDASTSLPRHTCCCAPLPDPLPLSPLAHIGLQKTCSTISSPEALVYVG